MSSTPIRRRTSLTLCSLLAAQPAFAEIQTSRDVHGVSYIRSEPGAAIGAPAAGAPRPLARVRFAPQALAALPRAAWVSSPSDFRLRPFPKPVVAAINPAPAAPATPAAPIAGTGGSWARRTRYADTIANTAQAHGLDPALLHAVIHAESSFNPNAVSRAGAMGLMQLMPATAARFGVTDAFDPAANIGGGAHYLRVLIDQFGQLPLALAAYNAGENRVIRSGYAIPPIEETQTYVSRVLAFYDRYRREVQ